MLVLEVYAAPRALLIVYRSSGMFMPHAQPPPRASPLHSGNSQDHMLDLLASISVFLLCAKCWEDVCFFFFLTLSLEPIFQC